MDYNQILAAVADLSTQERDQLQSYLLSHDIKRPQRTVEEWAAELMNISREFRGDSSDEEMREIFEAMSLKSIPSNKGA